MSVVPFIITFFISLDLLVWIRLHIMLGRMEHRWRWRVGLALMMLVAVSFAVVLGVANPTVFRSHRLIPQWIPATVFIWHFLVLPVVILALAADLAYRIARRISRWIADADSASARHAISAPRALTPLLSRRGFITATALAAPPLASLAMAGVGVSQLGEFRIKRYELAIAGWPADLSGFTIAFVADVHAGVFSSQKMLDDIVEATNKLRAELVLLGGDLVNISHADLPNALDMVLRLDSPNGLYMVQGNHDVIGGADHFNRMCAARGVPLLLNDAQTIHPRGIPIQLLGICWTDQGASQHEAVEITLQKRDPGLFPIFLAHHPHAWDLAAQRGVPLVLSGHTHGGQIMLTKHIGAGPLRFRYWSGLYQDRDTGSNLIVSNGVGDWFPLRINAPAEIVHITLHSPSRT